MNENQNFQQSLHQNIYPHKDIMNIKDIKGTTPDGHFQHTRNVDSNHITSEQIKNQPMHKSRHEGYQKTIRNPLFNDYYYKDYNKYPQTAGNQGYSTKTNNVINSFPHDYPMPNQVPQTAKNMYGSNSGSSSLPHLQKTQFKTASKEELGSIYNQKPLRYEMNKFRDHGYPYPRGPNDIRPPISSPSGGQNIVSNIVGGTAGKKEVLNFRAINGNNVVSQGNQQNNNQLQSQGQYDYRQPVSQSQVYSRSNNNQNYNAQNQFNNIMENKSLVYPQSNQSQNQQYNKPQSRNFSNVQQLQQQKSNNQISQDIKNQFFQPSNRPDITADRQKAEAKAFGTNINNNNNNNNDYNFPTQPADKQQEKSQNNMNFSQNQRKLSRQVSEPRYQSNIDTSKSTVYHENFGYKNIQNRYIHNNQSQHIPRSEHIYKDVGDVSGNIYQPFNHPNHKYAYGNFETKPNLDNMRENGDAKSGYSNKNWKPLNIISGKRHQQYTTTLKHDAWDWKLYDREQFKQWDGKSNHIKKLIKEKNSKIDKKPDFSVSNHEYGTKD